MCHFFGKICFKDVVRVLPWKQDLKFAVYQKYYLKLLTIEKILQNEFWIIKYKRFTYRNHTGKYLMEDVDIFDVVPNKRYAEF